MILLLYRFTLWLREKYNYEQEMRVVKVNFTFLNVVNKKNLFLRLKMRRSLNRYDQFNNSFYSKVQNGFLKMTKLNKKKYKIIDSNIDIKKNEKLIINQVKKLIK